MSRSKAVRKVAFVLLIAVVLSMPVVLRAATLPAGFSETTFVSGLSGPTAMAFSPDGRLFVCEQGGTLRVVKNGVLLTTPFVTLTVDSAGERGLLGVAFDPGFGSTNNFIYLYYTTTTPTTHNRVSRFTANGDVALAASELPILDLDDLSGATNHNGGSTHFGPDGKLYIGVGENANPANSQSIANRLGKILRINSDGTIPGDNPTSFPGIIGTTSGATAAIWAVGVRNPFTFAFQPGTGRMFINDVGQNIWEEINQGTAGVNYGWSVCEGACSPPDATYTDPLFQYGHGGTSTTGCAITGGTFYNPATPTFGGGFVGKYFFADLCSGWIRVFDPSSLSASDFASGISTPVDMTVTADGSLYYLARGAGSNTGIVNRVFANATTAAAVSISGRVMTTQGTGIRGASVSLVDEQGSTRIVLTNAFGYYAFQRVQAGVNYVVWAGARGYRFTPRVLDLTDAVSGFDLIAESPSPMASRPQSAKR